jgi:hypothetical protein
MKAFYLLALLASAAFSAPAPPTLCLGECKPITGANPLGIAFNNTTNVKLYAKPTGMIVAGRCLGSYGAHPDMQAARKGGAEVLQYIVPTERPDNRVCGPDMPFYLNDLSKVPLWPYPTNAPGTRSKWPGTKMTDMRAGSAWVLHVVAYVEQMARDRIVDGVFLDATSSMTWGSSAGWDSWSATEKDAYTLGNVDMVKRIRAMLKWIGREDFIVVNNGLWTRKDNSTLGLEGEKYVNGVMIEHHASTSKYHTNYAQRTFGVSHKRRVLVIGMSQDDARAWAKFPGVTHVSGQSSAEYRNPLTPAVPFVPLNR